MASNRFVRTSIVLVLAISLVAAACSSSGGADENTSTTSLGISEDADASTSTTKLDDAVDEQRTREMCRTLDLLSFAGVTAGPASQSLTRTDLVGLSPAATAQYGDLLVTAPRQACQEHIPFADEIAYWLGF